MENWKERYEKFKSSRQPPVCLAIAMEDFFMEEVPENCRRDYERYLKLRIRPMVQKLIESGDTQRLEQLDAMGWLTPALIEEFIRMAAAEHSSAVLMWLLNRKQETYGFTRPQFPL